MLQVIHKVHGTDGVACLYVTDYTNNSEISSTRINEPWSHRLEGRIMKISLWDKQTETANIVEPGSFYRIERLRVKRSATTSMVLGRLGGPNKHVYKLNPNRRDTDDPHLSALLQ